MLLRTLIGALIISLATSDYVIPVFLWGVENPAKSSIKTVTQQNFTELLEPILKSHMVVAFQEKHLTSRDFLCYKADGSASCYEHLSTVTPKTYYNNVQNPIEALRTLSKSREYNIVDSTGKLKAPLECKAGKITFVSFDDVIANERADILQAHDIAIADINKGLADCSIIYLYMSTANNMKLIKSRSLSAEVKKESFFKFREGNQFLIYWTELYYNDGSGKGYSLVTITSMTVQNTSSTAFNVSMPSDSGQTLEFTITLGKGYYTMSHIKYAGQIFYSKLLNAPFKFSYHCGSLTVNTVPPKHEEKRVAHLKWNSLQFQAPNDAMSSNTFSFGDSWDCVPFFTPAILSGLFVVILLLAVIFTGICWMIDINTMDRFDDAKGKTITINASD